MCKETDEPEFNYPEFCANGDISIPLELKVLMVLRTLGSGLMFNDAAEMTGYMSTSESNRLFKVFNRIFVLHFAHWFIRPLQGAELRRY
jgi:hypothetical protein